MTGLDLFSNLFLFSAIPVYTLSFIAYTADLSQRYARSAQNGSFAGFSKLLRIATALGILGFIFHLMATVLRGISAERVPWANMYEFTLSATCACVAVFLLVSLRVNISFLGALFYGLIVIFLGAALTLAYVPVTPLPPALQSYWLIIHIFVAVLATGFLMLGALLSFLQLLRNAFSPRWLKAVPDNDFLENIAYFLNIIGFAFWSFTLVAGAIWAEKAWGRFWGWDTKEIWTFIIWIIYAAYIHARATAGWRGNRSAILSLVGFTALVFNFTIINIFFSGLHSYSGLQ